MLWRDKWKMGCICNQSILINKQAPNHLVRGLYFIVMSTKRKGAAKSRTSLQEVHHENCGIENRIFNIDDCREASHE